MINAEVPAAVNLCESLILWTLGVLAAEEMVINYTYTDLGCKIIILDIGAPMSIAGVSWMAQYLKEFNLTIKEMKQVKFNKPFVLGPSKRYLSQTLVELLVLVMRLDGKEDVLIIKTYLMDAKVPFLCGKQTLENWNFRIYVRDKNLEIEYNTYGSRMKIKMIDVR